MAIVSPLIMCMSLSVCSAPIMTPNATRDNDIPKEIIESKIILPPLAQSSLSIAEQKPINNIVRYNITAERPLLSKPKPLPVFTTEIEFTPSSWPLRGTFNPLGMKLKLHMPL